MSEERLLSSLNESEPVKGSEKNFDDARIEKIKKDFNELRARFFKSKIKEIRKDLYRIENKKKISTTKIKGIEKNLFKLEKNLSKLKSIMIMMILRIQKNKRLKNLCDLSIKIIINQIRANSSFDNNYIEY